MLLGDNLASDLQLAAAMNATGKEDSIRIISWLNLQYLILGFGGET
jgi:hypothetical protein